MFISRHITDKLGGIMSHKPTLIMMMGPAGTAKTVLSNVIEESHDDCIIISKNNIRKNMFGKNFDKDKEDKVNKEYYKRISKALKIHKYVVADSSHVTLDSRKNFFYNVHIPKGTKIIGVWIESSVSIAIKNNSTKPAEDKVPDSVIKHMFKYKASPQNFEPFDNVFFLNAEADMGISRLSSKITTVIESLRSI